MAMTLKAVEPSNSSKAMTLEADRPVDLSGLLDSEDMGAHASLLCVRYRYDEDTREH